VNHLHDGTGHALTPREREVARLIARGYTNPQIASELTITKETVKSHVSNILSKLGVDGRGDVRTLYAGVERSQS
jgi:DNA-binding NarL/FixJ family response regulator